MTDQPTGKFKLRTRDSEGHDPGPVSGPISDSRIFALWMIARFEPTDPHDADQAAFAAEIQRFIEAADRFREKIQADEDA